VKDDIEKQLAEKWQKAQDAMTEIEQGIQSLEDGTALKELGADLADIPLAAIGGAFAGFKNALECLEGAAGSAKAEFNKEADALGEDLENGGRGLSATAAEEAITSQAEETTDENGNKIKKQKTISREDAAKSVEGTTKNAVPQSDTPLATEKESKSEWDTVTEAAVYKDGARTFYTIGNKRRLTPEETERAYSGLMPKFTKIAARRKGLAEGDTVEIANAKYDEERLRSLDEQGFGTDGTRLQKRREKLRVQTIRGYEKRGEVVPAKYLTPNKMTRVETPHVVWYGQRFVGDGSEALHHPASYNVEFPMPEYDKDATGPILSSKGVEYHWLDGELVKK